MRTLLMLGLAASVVVCAPVSSGAQTVPHEMKEDTPPVPGQIEETRHEKLHPGPSAETDDNKQLGLPPTGQMATEPPKVDPARNELVQRRFDYNPLF